MTRRERIELLLKHYQAVLEGIPGIAEPDDDDLLALMCEEWNHPSYQQLERLLYVMHQRWPRHRQALRVRYERYEERRVAFCTVCGRTEHAEFIGRTHVRGAVAGAKLRCKLGAQTPDMVERIVRIEGGDPLLVIEAVEWLERHWRGDAIVPATILRYEHDRLAVAA